MTETLQFDLVSPERKLVSVQAAQVELPGDGGDLTAMPDHAPILTALRPGIVRVHAGGSVSEYFLTGGFAELANSALTVLAEKAVPRSEMTVEMVDAAIAEAEAGLVGANEDNATAAALRLNDIRVLKQTLGY